MSDRFILAMAALSAMTGALLLLGSDSIDQGALIVGFGLALLLTAVAAFVGAMVKRRRLSNAAAQWIIVGAFLVIVVIAFVYGEIA